MTDIIIASSPSQRCVLGLLDSLSGTSLCV